MKKIYLPCGTMNFINCSVPLSTDKGLHVVSSGCGSEKTTMIQEIIQEKWKDGILVVVPTINDAEDHYDRIEIW